MAPARTDVRELDFHPGIREQPGSRVSVGYCAVHEAAFLKSGLGTVLPKTICDCFVFSIQLMRMLVIRD
jgi:hypothetical protein